MSASPIDVVSLSPASSGAVAWRIAGVDRVTIVVKATFALIQDGVAPLVSPSALVREDQLRDRSGKAGSLRRASELAPYLPVAGVVVTGQACAPAGKPATQLSVRLAVTRGRPLIDKTLHVYGDRTPSAPGPAPFQRMPIVYERAFGGPNVDANPVGVGAQAGSPAPNVVDPRDPRKPAGFGPIAAHWPARKRLVRRAEPPELGGFIEIPDGFDWSYFCAAPLDQRIDFLRGDEWITLDGVSASVPRLQTRLPSAHARVRYWIDRPAGDGVPREVDMVGDTLIIDVDRQICSVAWRGSFLVGRDALPWVHVLTGVEFPTEPIAWPESAGVDLDLADPISATRESEERDEAEPITARRPPIAALPEGADRDHSVARTTTATVSRFDAPALPFQDPPPTQAPPVEAAPPQRLEAAPDDDSEERFTRTSKVDVAALARSALPFRVASQPETPKPIVLPDDDEDGVLDRTSGVDIAAVKRAALPFQNAARAASAPTRATSNAGLPFQAAPPKAALAKAIEPVVDDPSTLPEMLVPPQVIAPTPTPTPAPAPLPVPVVEAARVIIASAPLEIPEARRRAIAKLAARESFDDADFAGADLHDLDFSGRSLARVNLRGADLRGARFGSAKLVGAQLADANLSGADLGSSDLTRADLARANVAGASFEKARLEDVKLSLARGAGAIFRGASGRRTGFARGAWEDAIFDEAEIAGADFTGATLDRASFRCASLADVRLNDARGERVSFEGATLTSARARGATLAGCTFDKADARLVAFAKADLQGATFVGANLEGANFSEARCARASFANANLGDATLEHADLASAIFVEARLQGANLQRARGDGADLRAANLAGADLRFARFQRASFVDAAMQGARADEIDLADARLERSDLSRACLRGAHLERAVLAHTRLDATDLRNAILEGANVHGASRATARVGGANMNDLIESPPEDPIPVAPIA